MTTGAGLLRGCCVGTTSAGTAGWIGRSRVLDDMECSGLGGGTGGVSRCGRPGGSMLPPLVVEDESRCARPGSNTVAWVLVSGMSRRRPMLPFVPAPPLEEKE